MLNGFGFSATPPLPSGVWSWLTSGNFFDNEGFGGLPCPKMGKSYFNGWIGEKLSLDKGLKLFNTAQNLLFRSRVMLKGLKTGNRG
jgi:hypothetical protein